MDWARNEKAFVKLGFLGAPIQLRVVYALIASVLWWAMFEIAVTIRGTNGEYLRWATGAVFSALVLIPYLPSLKGTFKLRAIALLFCGALSYWAAIRATNHIDLNHRFFVPEILLSDQWRTLVTMYLLGIAGVVGAVIIGIVARLLVPLVLRWIGCLGLMGAGFLGGLVVGFGISVDEGSGGLNLFYFLPGHIAWQVLVCLALYYGSNRDSESQRASSTSELSPNLSTIRSTNSRWALPERT